MPLWFTRSAKKIIAHVLELSKRTLDWCPSRSRLVLLLLGTTRRRETTQCHPESEDDLELNLVLIRLLWSNASESYAALADYVGNSKVHCHRRATSFIPAVTFSVKDKANNITLSKDNVTMSCSKVGEMRCNAGARHTRTKLFYRDFGPCEVQSASLAGAGSPSLSSVIN